MKENPQFLDAKYKDLTGSKPVERAVEQAKRDPERVFSPHKRDERIQAYLNRLDHIIEDERGWELLRYKILKEFAIDATDEDTVTKIAYNLYESEKRLAIEQGRGQDIRQLEQQEDIVGHYRNAVVEKQEIQEQTLDAWLSYLQENDAEYPTWFRYFVVRNLKQLGSLNKEKGEYTKRTDYTIAPFPELNSEALGFVYRMLTTGIGHQEYTYDPERHTPEERLEIEQKRKQLEQLIDKKDFGKLYVFAQMETSGELNRESIQGEWVKYEQGSDHHKLENSLRGKGTGWCTAEGSAYAHLQGGDFYVYYTKGKGGTYSEPRVAIRMEGDHVAEVRGVGKRQELEPVLVDIAQEKYHHLPGGEKFDKKSQDMKKMTELVKKQEEGKELTKDDLRFLYEIDTPIEGFGYERDTRIEELRKKRNRTEDIQTLCACPPEYIATDFVNIKEDTQVYYEDTGRKITFFDFREEKNKEKLPKLLELAQVIKESGSPARPDMSFEGGVVSIAVPQEKLKDIHSALKAYKEGDNNSPSNVWEEWQNLDRKDFTTPEANINAVILSYNNDPKTRQSSEKIVADMEKLNLRPATIAELIALGIVKPEFNKRSGAYLVGLGTKAFLGGALHVPGLGWNVGERMLGRRWFGNEWYAWGRFVCVRKS